MIQPDMFGGIPVRYGPMPRPRPAWIDLRWRVQALPVAEAPLLLAMMVARELPLDAAMTGLCGLACVTAGILIVILAMGRRR